MRRLRTLALAALLFLPAVPSAQQDAQRELARARSEERQVLSELSDIDQDLAGIEQEIDDLRHTIDKVEARRRSDEDALAAGRAAMDALRGEVAARVLALYRVNRQGFARVLFSAEDPADLRRRSRYLLAILDADRSRTTRFLARIRERRQALARVNSDRAALAATQAQLRLDESGLRDKRTRRAALLAEIRRRRDLALAALQQRARASRELGARLGALGDRGAPSPSVSFRKLGGRLPWPTTGTLMRGFGRYTDPLTGQQVRDNGIEIKAAFGTPIRVVADGTVEHTGFIEGFGLTVVVQHGPYATVYAHAARVQVARGQPVGQGDVIGLVGETGTTDGLGPRLHFEIRYHQTPQDPLPWLRPGRRRPAPGEPTP